MEDRSLPLPPHFDPDRVGEVRRVPYLERAAEAERWAAEHSLQPAGRDALRVCLLAVDIQNTFCNPEFELFVAGPSGTGATDDVRRTCEFLYRNLGFVTTVAPTLDTHQALQIFHSLFFTDDRGNHPEPMTVVTVDDVESGAWRVDAAVCAALGRSQPDMDRYLRHYVRSLRQAGKYELTVWPYHAMLGGIGHALVSAFEETVFFHSVARRSRVRFQIKGRFPLTEHYSALGPEVLEGADGRRVGNRDEEFIRDIGSYDVVIVTGQAKSHCVAWTVQDLLDEPGLRELEVANRLYLLEDCTSPVVVPGGLDYSERADDAFSRFSRAGVHVVRSTTPVGEWPGMPTLP